MLASGERAVLGHLAVLDVGEDQLPPDDHIRLGSGWRRTRYADRREPLSETAAPSSEQEPEQQETPQPRCIQRNQGVHPLTAEHPVPVGPGRPDPAARPARPLSPGAPPAGPGSGRGTTPRSRRLSRPADLLRSPVPPPPACPPRGCRCA